MKHAVFDCDDVLANLRSHVLFGFSEILGYEVHLEELTNFDLNKVFGDKINVNEFFLNTPLEDLHRELNASALTHKLKNQGYRTTVVTARGFMHNAHERTVNWLAKNDILIDEVIVVPLFGDKGAVLAELGDIDVYIEDNHNHAEAAHNLANVKNVCLMDRPWNQECPYGQRVQNLFSVENFLKLEGLLQ